MTRTEKLVLAWAITMVTVCIAFFLYVDYLNVTRPNFAAPACAEKK